MGEAGWGGGSRFPVYRQLLYLKRKPLAKVASCSIKPHKKQKTKFSTYNHLDEPLKPILNGVVHTVAPGQTVGVQSSSERTAL